MESDSFQQLNAGDDLTQFDNLTIFIPTQKEIYEGNVRAGFRP